MPEKTAPDPAAWSYAGPTGPEYWWKIAPLCAEGKEQSPVDLDDSSIVRADLPPIRFDYGVRAIESANNGHAIVLRFSPGGRFEVGDRHFDLDHLHFHVPAEHRVGGKAYAMEAHFVNVNEAGKIAVVALLCNVGPANPALAQVLTRLPDKDRRKRPAEDSTLTAADFLPDTPDYYYYHGSLTTPPATEGVDWFVLRTQLTVAPEQAEKLLHAVGEPNNRPLQPLNGRKILAPRETA